MEYWLLGPENKPKGPYPEERIRAGLAAGKLNARTMICPVGGTEWTTVGTVFGMGADAGGAARGAASSAPQEQSFMPSSDIGLMPAESDPLPMRAMPVARPSGQVGSWTPVNLVWPILATLCCCVPGGIVAIIYTVKANAAGNVGNFAEAEAHAKKAKLFLLLSVVIGFVVSLVGMGLQMLPLFFGNGRY